MQPPAFSTLVFGLVLLAGAPAAAQRMPFERSILVNGAAIVDISTLRGKIDVTGGAPGRVLVAGAATVRAGFNVPLNAVELARKVAAQPPIQQAGNSVTLTEPDDAEARRAVIINYVVQVPPGTSVRTRSDSGATMVRDVTGPVEIRTQSAEIRASALGGAAAVTTGSGDVDISSVAGALTVTTQSSAIELQSIAGDVRVRTQSGAVNVGVVGRAAVDVETGSSAVHVFGVRGALTATTGSGAVTVRGQPGESGWTVSSRSGSVDMRLLPAASFRLDAESGSGSVTLKGAPITGTVAKKSITGTIGAGGAPVQVRSRSGSVQVTVEAAAALR